MTDGIKKEKAYGCIPACTKDGGLFLLVENKKEHDSDFWSFPRGHKKAYEYEFDAALRELEEETGLLPDEFIKEEVFTQRYSYQKEGQTVDKKNTYYLTLFADPYPPEVTVSEITDARWVSYDEAQDLLAYPESLDLLKEAYLTLTMNGLIE